MADGDPPQQPDEPDDTGPSDPLSSLPLFGDLSRALAHQGPLNWDAARQFAQMSATGGAGEANVDPTVRLRYGELAEIARMHVAGVLGDDLSTPEPQTVTRSQWATTTLEAYRHLFTEMATSLGTNPEAGDTADPMTQMMAGLAKLMAPAMVGMSIGSMVGRLATRTFGTHDLPIPREPDSVTLVPANVDSFAEQWEIPLDEMRLWVLAHEITGFTLFSSPHVRGALAELVRRHAGGFAPDPEALSQKLGAFDEGESGDPMAALRQALGDPEILLGAITSPAQQQLRPQLDALVAVVVGYTDWVVDAVAVSIIGGNALRIAEAVRRQRADQAGDDRFVEQLLGIRIGETQVARGKAFVQGVVDRAGESALSALRDRPDSIPTPNELDAPGLWLARLESTREGGPGIGSN